MTVAVEVAGRTHVGLVRQRNEDALYVGEHLVAVADGLGGHVAGDVASGTVVGALRPHDRPVAPTDLLSTLGRAIHDANEALRRRIRAEPDLAGMASTLVAMLWSGTSVALANVGDSRAYVLPDRDAPLMRLTEDHIYEHLVSGAAAVANLPERLSRFLDGRADGRSPDLIARGLHAGERYLLCSDGLTSYVPGEAIRETLGRRGPADDAADRLTALALDHGAPDNVTLVVIEVSAARP